MQSNELLVISKPVVSPFWLIVGAAALSLGWLLPNHYSPWSSFHMDAWSAAVLSVVAIAVIFRSPAVVAWQGMAVLIAVLACVPWLQYSFGLIFFAGVSWVASLYLLGLLLALLVGARWELATPGQLADFLFLAIGIAAVVSVGLQLHQWLMLDGLDIWSMGQGYGRPFANFGQPNQLATLLLWALLGIAWAVVRGRIGAWTATFIAAYILFGLALTASRTAWLAVFFMLAACWIWRPLWPNRRAPLLVSALAMLFAAYVLSIGWLGGAIMIAPAEPQDIVRVGTEARPAVWAMFGDAALRHPMAGYGWGPLSTAQVEVAPEHPVMKTVYSHSHNLFLDLVLWCGIPIGLLVCLYLAYWFWNRIKRTSSAEEALMILFIVVVVNHAMLEFPLQYAYFLLPVGLVMGALEARIPGKRLWLPGRGVTAGLWLVLVIFLALLIRDYSRVERTYEALRFEWAGYATKSPTQPPNTLLLNHWQGYVWFVELEPTANMSLADIEMMRALTRLHPSSGFFHKLATALALNNRPEEAQWWLTRICKIVTVYQCAAVKQTWAKQSVTEPGIARVAWPG
jgi:O-antigen ligase